MITKPATSEAAKVVSRLSSWLADARRYGVGQRTQIIDPRLCSDVLKRLGPSLERHKGCDLIDVLPGAGLWSEQLHDYLKPRRHILIEPSKDFFKPFLQPLLDRYPETIVWPDEGLKTILHDENLFGQIAQKADWERMTVNNDNILLNINLAGPVKGDLGPQTGRADQYFWNNIWGSMLRLRDDLFCRGLIRILAWVPDEDKISAVPRSAGRAHRLSIGLELASTVTEVAGGPASLIDRDWRWRRMYDQEMEDMTVPRTLPEEALSPTRIDLLPLPTASDLPAHVPTLAATDHLDHHDFLDRIIELDDYVKENDPDFYQKAILSLSDPGRRGRFRTQDPQAKEWLLLYTNMRSKHKGHRRRISLVHEQRALEQEWRALPAAAPAADRAFIERAKDIMARVDKLKINDRTNFRKHIDDYRIMDNHSTHWYRRTSNPLITHPREFAASHNPETSTLALLDIQPNPRFRAKFNTDLKHVCLDHILRHFTAYLAKDVYTGIAALLNDGGVEEFLKLVPNLTDVREGGYYDLKELRARTLPPELWEDIALAYAEWPFRNSEESLMFGMKNAQKNLGVELEGVGH